MNGTAANAAPSRRPTTLVELVGAIVLATQDVEHWLKAILPFIDDGTDPSLRSALQRHERLKLQSFGNLKNKFLDESDSNAAFVAHLDSLVSRRNAIAHHYVETYGQAIAAGRHYDVARELRVLLRDIDEFGRLLQLSALAIFEAMRDTTFAGTDEYEEFARTCAQFRELAGRPSRWEPLLEAAPQ